MSFVRIALLFAIMGGAAVAYAQKTLSDGVTALAEQVISGLSGGKQRVAVMPLKTLDGNDSMLGAYISEELGTILATQKVQVIERALLTPVVDEIKLQDTGAIDPATAKRVGKLVGADAIITGTIAELPTTLRINCRVIATETGEVLTGARTVITIDADVEVLKNARLGPSQGTAPTKRSSRETSQNQSWSWQRGALLFSIDGLRGTGKTLTTTVTVQNTGGEGKSDYLGSYWLIDENGDRWSGQLPNGDRWQNITIAPGTKRRFQFTFAPETTASGTTFTLTNEDNSLSLVQDLVLQK